MIQDLTVRFYLKVTAPIKDKIYKLNVRVCYVNDYYEIYMIEGKRSIITILTNRIALHRQDVLKNRKPNFYIINNGGLSSDDLSNICMIITEHLNKRINPNKGLYEN